MLERGNAPAEFVMVSALLVALVLGSIQVVVAGYVRHVLVSAASEGARAGSLVDASHIDAVSRTKSQIEASLSSQYSQGISVANSTALGVPTLEVTVNAPVPALGLWSAGGVMKVSAHAPLDYVR